MFSNSRYNIKVILFTILWIIIGSASVVLLVAAVRKKDEKICKGIDINISGVSNNFFIDQHDVKKIIAEHAGKNAVGKNIEGFDLRSMETALRKDVWIKDAELYFDNNEVLRVKVEEREPVARIFTISGNTFYIDSSNMKLPLSEKFSARLPVFTGFPTDVIILSRGDSNLLNDIKNISTLIQADPFLMAMIDQVDITGQNNFEMIPKIGNQVIVFGDAMNAIEKFNKLKLFYKKVMTKMGWNLYSSINLQYKNQVVAKIKGRDDVSADSLRTIQMMDIIAANAEKMSQDSLQAFVTEKEKNTDASMIQQSLQREELGDNSNTSEEPKPQERLNLPVVKPFTKPIAKPIIKKDIKPVQKAAVKTIIKKPVDKEAVEKPKAVMPKKVNK
ncbi:MAG: hypothetical protein ABIO04_00340 [Ferruginibacter sp.]